MRHIIKCKQIVHVPSDGDDRLDFNLGLNGIHTAEFEVASVTEALDTFHSTRPIGCLEDYEIWVEDDNGTRLTEGE